MSRRTGGLAFPRPGVKDGYGNISGGTEGMTLRDYFAAQALREVIASDGYEIAEGRSLLAANCYAIADAMLAERQK